MFGFYFLKDAGARMPTASMSKTMTMYMLFDALKAGRVALEDEFLVSERAWRMQGSKMFIHVGDKVKVEDLIRGVIIQSGNDAAVAVAEGLAGSEEAFASAMNARMQEIGMKDSHFMNASGWPMAMALPPAIRVNNLSMALKTNGAQLGALPKAGHCGWRGDR